VAAARGLTRFVGREREVEQRSALGHAATGHGQVVAIVGEPGVGKSRLVWEVTHSHRTHGWLIVQSGSVSYGKATPYLPVIDLLKGYFQVEDRDDQRKIREKVVGKLLTLDESLKPTLPAFLGLLDVPVDDPQWQALDPPQRRQRTLDAIKRLLLRESQGQPLLVVFEDLHWIDGETQALLDSLVESVPTAQMLLLVNYRPEYIHRWGSKTYYTQLRLDALPPASAELLLQAILGDDPTLQPLKALLVARTEGNPFFLEESVQTLVETKALMGTRGAYRAMKPIERTEVPATVHAVLAARIDRLPPVEKRLLQAASVIGKDVPYPILAAIADEPEDALRRGIAHLQAIEFLYETNLFPDPECTFKHALTHEVAYGSLLQERRQMLHSRIAEAIETIHKDRLTEHVERLAHHAHRGEVWDNALVYLRQAGSKAVERGALQEAVTYFEQAVATLDRLPHSPTTLDEGIDLRLSVRNALYALGEHEPTFTHLQAAERLATERGDPRRLARVLRYVSTHFVFVGDYALAVEAGQRAVRSAESSGDPDLRLETRLGLALIHVTRGEYPAATDAFRRVASDLADEGSPPRLFGIVLMSAMAFGFLASALAERGEFGDAGSVAAEALRRAEAHEPRYSAVFGAWSVGYVSVRRGDLAGATRVLRPALDHCRATGLPIVFPAVASMLGLAYALAGRHAEGIPLLEEAVEQRARGWVHSTPLACLGEGYLLAGRAADAGRVTMRALDLARARGERGVEAWALRLLGEGAFKGGSPPDVEAATDYYRQALALATELDMRPLAAHCHLGLGQCYRRFGDQAKAQEHLTVAAMMYREMDMGFWLAQAEAQLSSTLQ
jgi:tetratricopeptide (TPR) repeat protein